MPMPYYVSPEQVMQDKAEYAKKGIAKGRSIAEIADRLVISVHTARTHVKNIYSKLDAHNRVQALDRARELRILR